MRMSWSGCYDARYGCLGVCRNGARILSEWLRTPSPNVGHIAHRLWRIVLQELINVVRQDLGYSNEKGKVEDDILGKSIDFHLVNQPLGY